MHHKPLNAEKELGRDLKISVCHELGRKLKRVNHVQLFTLSMISNVCEEYLKTILRC